VTFRTLLAACLFLVSYLTYSSTVLMKAIHSSEMTVYFYRIGLFYIIEDVVCLIGHSSSKEESAKLIGP
jgi:hypothetical protein